MTPDIALSRLRNIVSDLKNEVKFVNSEAGESATRLAEEADAIIESLRERLGPQTSRDDLTLEPE